MKKFFPVILIILAVAVALLPTTAVAQTNYQQTQEYLFMQEFCQKFPNRVAGTQQEREAGQFLAETFEQVVQGKHNSSVNVVPFACNERDVSANVVVTLDCPTSSEQVIVGAHYDAVGVGAGDNASGVTALWATLKAIANLP
ncbi:MAG: M28 family peptidase, partial [Clostridia bacterium]|nr:M28 family peptidase [Clostridia bacterium]